MKTLPEIVDPIFVKKEYNGFEKFWINLINDERDLPFVYLCLKLTFLLIPAAILLYTPFLNGWAWAVAAVVYASLAFGMFMGPFILMLHNTSHRRFFKREYEVGNYYIPWVLGFFFGQSPETYFSHHIGMHHAENNQIEDLSCTMYYQRDNFWHFMHYFGVFLTIGVGQLVGYFTRRERKKFVVKVIRGEFTFILFCILLSVFVSFKATFIVFILPFIVSRFAMMSGNWAQHAFICKDDPENNFCNSITVINSVYNKQCFNDGYHIGHHLRPHMHWTDMPVDFKKNVQKYADQNAIVFEGMDFNAVWFWLMLKRYDVLADRFINLGNRFKTNEEVIEMLKRRTKQIERPASTVKAA